MILLSNVLTKKDKTEKFIQICLFKVKFSFHLFSVGKSKYLSTFIRSPEITLQNNYCQLSILKWEKRPKFDVCALVPVINWIIKKRSIMKEEGKENAQRKKKKNLGSGWTPLVLILTGPADIHLLISISYFSCGCIHLSSFFVRLCQPQLVHVHTLQI